MIILTLISLFGTFASFSLCYYSQKNYNGFIDKVVKINLHSSNHIPLGEDCIISLFQFIYFYISTVLTFFSFIIFINSGGKCLKCLDDALKRLLFICIVISLFIIIVLTHPSSSQFVKGKIYKLVIRLSDQIGNSNGFLTPMFSMFGINNEFSCVNEVYKKVYSWIPFTRSFDDVPSCENIINELISKELNEFWKFSILVFMYFIVMYSCMKFDKNDSEEIKEEVNSDNNDD